METQRVVCPYCGEALKIQLDPHEDAAGLRIPCPSCGKGFPLAVRAESGAVTGTTKGKSSKKGMDAVSVTVLVLAGLFLLVIIIGAITAPSSKSSSGGARPASTSVGQKKKPPTYSYMNLGDIGTLEGPQFVGTTQAGWTQYVKAVQAKDEHGKMELAEKGLLGFIVADTKVRCIESGSDCVKLRVLEGDFEGEACYTTARLVLKK